MLDMVTLLQTQRAKHGPRPLFGRKVGSAWRYETYEDFGQRVDACRARLATLDVAPGERVAIISGNCIEWVAYCFAAYGLRAAWVPMYAAQLEDDWMYILRDSGARICLVEDEALESRIAARRTEAPALQHIVRLDVDTSIAAETPAQSPDADDVANIVYTSGTTGRPKGVLLTHKNLAAAIGGVMGDLPLSAETRFLSFLPWAHVGGGVSELLGIISLGASTALAEGPDKILQNLGEVRPTALVAVPRIWNRLRASVEKQVADAPAPARALFRTAMEARSKARRGERLRKRERLAVVLAERLIFRKVRERLGGRLEFALSGAAALSQEVGEFIDNLGITVLEGWGMTETSGVATLNRLDSRRIGSVGKPLRGVRVTVDRDKGHDGEHGELIVHGDFVMKGYHGIDDAAGSAVDADGGLRTGDLGRVDAEGFVWITGRVKERFKLENGKYVAPVAVEEKMMLSRFVTQAFIHGDNRPHTVALVAPDIAELRAWAQANAPDLVSDTSLLENARVLRCVMADVERYLADVKSYERPKRIALLAEEFTTANGLLTPSLKVKRSAVLARYAEVVASLYR